MEQDKLIKYAVELQSIAQAGLFYGKDVYDRERYERIREISAEMIADKTELPLDTVKGLFCSDYGYQTPKIDTRAAIFRDGKILLVHESNGAWSLPGGWCEVDMSPVANTVKEAKEEAGRDIVVKSVIAVQDRSLHNQPLYAYGVVKIFYLCEELGGEFCENSKTVGVGYFAAAGAGPVDFRIYFVYTFAQKAALTRRQTTMASNFEFYSPTRVIFGKGTEQRVGALVREYGGTRVLIVYGGKSAVRSGVLDRAEKSLAEAGISSWTLGGVVPNPHLDKVYEGIRIGKENSIDFLLAVGGGSVIDTAKAIAYGLAEPEKDVWELYEHTRTASKCLPVASILTIAAAGSETSNSSVITRVDTHQKRAYNDDISRPKFALMDPELTKTLPDYQTESGCADIMMHTMERYFTNGGNMELTDVLAEGLLRTVMKNAVILHTDPANYEARAEVMWAGSLSHNGLTGCGIACGDFMSHKLEHEMGGMFDVTHGAGLAAIWPSWARYVYKDCLPRFVRFARNVMGVTTDGTDEEIALKGIEAMVDFYHSIGMPASFHELGIDPTDAQIDEMARRCLEASGSALGSAKKLDLDDMIAIYHAANH